MKVRADGPNDDFTGVQPNSNLNTYTACSPYALGVPPKRLLHPQSGIASEDAVILVSNRRSEQGHDAVAHYLVHCAFVTMYSLDHVLEYGIENSARLLRVAVGQELHRTLEVSEEHGDLLPFPLD
jgi:hypothetical protein